MSKNKANKKDNPLVGGIILLICGILMIAVGQDYLWVLFGVIEIPLQIVGVVAAVLGVLCTVKGIKEKKKTAQEAETPEQ